MKIEASETEKAATLALAKICAIICLKVMGDTIKALKVEIVDPNYRKVLSFLAEYSDDTKPFTECCNNMLKKGEVVEPYAQALGQFLRGVLNKNNLKNNVDILSSNTRYVLNPCLSLMVDPTNQNALTSITKAISGLGDTKLTAAYVALFGEMAAQRNAEPDITPKTNKPVGTKPTVPQPVSQKRTETPSVPESNGVQTIENITRKIKQLGKQITGKNDITAIPVADKVNYRQDPEKAQLIKEFDKLRKQLADVKINEVRAIVTASGKPCIPVKEVVRGLKARGFKQTTIPEGLLNSTVVYMNTDADFCDSNGRVAVRQGGQPGAVFEHNSDYQHDTPKKNWLFKIKTVTAEGKPTTNYVQTETKVAANRADRFAKVEQTLEQGIDRVKDQWRGSMDGDVDGENTVFSNIAEYLYWTASRAGTGEGETAGSRTYGASNFLVKHIQNMPKTKGAAPSQLRIHYPTKSGGNGEFTLSSNVKDLPSKNDAQYCKKLIRFIVEKAQGKKPDDIVFTVKGKRVNNDRLNGFLRSVAGDTAKSFRTLRATELAAYALGEAKKEYDKLLKQNKSGKVPASTVNQLFDAAMTSVGELLGHVRNTDDEGQKITPNTAIKSYVKPDLMVNWYKDVNTAPPKKVVSAARMAGIEV